MIEICMVFGLNIWSIWEKRNFSKVCGCFIDNFLVSSID